MSFRDGDPGSTYKSSLVSLKPSSGLQASVLMCVSGSDLAKGHASPRVQTSALLY